MASSRWECSCAAVLCFVSLAECQHHTGTSPDPSCPKSFSRNWFVEDSDQRSNHQRSLAFVALLTRACLLTDSANLCFLTSRVAGWAIACLVLTVFYLMLHGMVLACRCELQMLLSLSSLSPLAPRPAALSWLSLTVIQDDVACHNARDQMKPSWCWHPCCCCSTTRPGRQTSPHSSGAMHLAQQRCWPTLWHHASGSCSRG